MVHTCQSTCFRNHMVCTCCCNHMENSESVAISSVPLQFACLFVFKTFPTCESVFCATVGSYSCRSTFFFRAEPLKLTVCHLLSSFSLPSCVYCLCHFKDTKFCAVSILKFLLNFFVRCI